MKSSCHWLPTPGCAHPGNLAGLLVQVFLAPGGVWPPCSLPSFPSLPCDSLLLQARGQGCLEPEYTGRNPAISLSLSSDPRGKAPLPSAHKLWEMTPASSEGPPLIGIATICHRMPAGHQVPRMHPVISLQGCPEGGLVGSLL